VAFALFAVLLLFQFNQPALAQTTERALPVVLSTLFDNDGIANANRPTDGNLDGSGYSLPAEHLPHAGLTTIGGVPFLFPGASPGERNNLIANGQRIELPPGRYHAATLLAAATYGPFSGRIKLHYADGEERVFSFHLDDWYSDPKGMIEAPFRYTPEGKRDEHPVVLDAIRLPVDYRRTLIAITLPPAKPSRTRLGIFSMTLHPVRRGIAADFYAPDSGPQTTVIRGTRQTVRLLMQNMGTDWIADRLGVRVMLEADGVKTVGTSRIASLAPGEMLELMIDIESSLSLGTVRDATVRLIGKDGALATLELQLLLGAPTYTADPASLDRHPSVSWFDNAKFGIFIHWGVYSVPAWAPVGGVFAEWYWESMNDATSAIHKHHAQRYGEYFAYDDFIPAFKGERFDPRDWVELIEAAGARYFVFTAKHHDGFAMYDTEATGRNSAVLGPARNVLRELFSAAEQHAPQLKRGVYYSLYEWYHPAYTGRAPINPYTRLSIPYTGSWLIGDYVRDQVKTQLRELIDNYDPDILWCDGEGGFGATYWQTGEAVARYYNRAQYRQLSKEVVVNDRCAIAPPFRSRHGADFQTMEYATHQAAIPQKWEMTRGLDPHSFGFNSATPVEAYLSTDEAIDTLIDTVSKNGNFLLNIGPAGDGSIPPVMRDRLLGIGDWLEKNGEAIYGTNYWWRTSEEGNLRFTVGPNGGFYIMALEWPGDRLVVKSPVPIRRSQRIELLRSGTGPLAWRHEGGNLIVELPSGARDAGRFAWVFRIS
jgi:alpha-L-fucosidase